MARRTFTPEFKRETVELVTIKGFSLSKACEYSGVGPTALRRWVAQLESELAGQTPVASKAITDEHREIQRLKAEVEDLKLDNEILKKATALLASDFRKDKKLFRR